MQHRRALANDWNYSNPILLEAEIGYEKDTKKFKIGDGVTAWTSLAYYSGPLSKSVVLCAAFTPTAIGPDPAELTVPFSNDGITPVNWAVRGIRFRVQTAGGAPSVRIEKSPGAGLFAPSTVGTVTLGAGAYEGNSVSSLGSVTSGEKLRFNVLETGTSEHWTIQVDLAQ